MDIRQIRDAVSKIYEKTGMCVESLRLNPYDYCDISRECAPVSGTSLTGIPEIMTIATPAGSVRLYSNQDVSRGHARVPGRYGTAYYTINIEHNFPQYYECGGTSSRIEIFGEDKTMKWEINGFDGDYIRQTPSGGLYFCLDRDMTRDEWKALVSKVNDLFDESEANAEEE